MSENNVSPITLAVLVVNFRRAVDTVECLDSLLRIQEPRFDIFLVDNGSGEEDAALLNEYAARYPEWITFFADSKNRGFTGAHNRLFADILPKGSYQYLLLLNNDTVVEPDFLARMLTQIDRSQRIEMVAARMMKYDDRNCVDNLGITFYKCGLASNRKSTEDPLLGPCGGCALYTADLLQQVYQATGEYFDEQFFCYAEDTDLAWRAVLLGYRAAYAEDAVVYHKGSVASGGPNSDFVLYHGIRNSLFVLVKDVPLYFLMKNLGWIVLLHSAIFLRYMVKGKLKVVLSLYRDFMSGISTMRKKRQFLFKKKLPKIKEINQLVSRNFYDHQYLRSALKELIPENVRVYFPGGFKT